MKTNVNPWPYGIIAAFALLFCGIGTAITIACTHRESLVADNYYEQEIGFQGRIDALARARSSGATLAFDATQNAVTLTLPAAQRSVPVSGHIELYRPSAPELDRDLPFHPAANGAQTVDVSRLAVGNWDVRAAWQAGGQDYYLVQKIDVGGK